MRPRDHGLGVAIDASLLAFQQQVRPLPGIQNPAPRTAFIEQVLESIHRIQYFSAIRTRDISPRRLDPTSELFDPLKGAIIQHQQGQIDEAFWLAFLAVHFGKNRRKGWQLTRDIYGQLGSGVLWDWNAVSNNPAAFRQWLAANQLNIPRNVGNHRKYLSLNANSATGTGAAIETYVNWIGPTKSHQTFIQIAQQQAGNTPRDLFKFLYKSMSAVAYFGRTGKFDYLSMIGKLGLAAVEPDLAYIQGSTGPLPGARLLFGGSVDANLSAKTLDAFILELEPHLNQPFGMQILEDALCNWQKSPNRFIPFRG